MARVPFKDKWAKVKPYVTFKVSKAPTDKQKRLVNTYFRELYGYARKESNGQVTRQPGLANGTKYPIRASKRDRDNPGRASRDDLFTLSRTPKLSQLKHAWFDSVAGKSGKILKPIIKRGRKGDLAYRVGYVSFGFLPFHKRSFAIDPEREVKRLLGTTTSKRFVIACGAAKSRNQESRRTAAAKVVRWANQYANHKEWLDGLIPLDFKGQKDYREYKAHRQVTLDSVKKLNAKAKRAAKRKPAAKSKPTTKPKAKKGKKRK